MLDLASIVFEQATAKDASALVELERSVAIARIYEPRMIDEVISETSGNTLYLIKYRNAVVGSVSVRLKEDGVAYFGNLAVVPAYRRKGIARAAMTFLMEKHKHAARFELVTHPDNEAALRLYASLEFKAGAVLANFFGDGEPRVLLSRTPMSATA